MAWSIREAKVLILQNVDDKDSRELFVVSMNLHSDGFH